MYGGSSRVVWCRGCKASHAATDVQRRHYLIPTITPVNTRPQRSACCPRVHKSRSEDNLASVACMHVGPWCLLSAFRCRLSLVCVHACLHALEYPLCLQAHRVSLTLTRFVVCRPLSPRDTDRRCMLTWVAMCYLLLARHVRACMRSQLRPPTNPSQQSADHLVSFRTCSEQVTCINFHTRVSSHCRGCVHHVSTVVHNCSCCDCSGSATNRV